MRKTNIFKRILSFMLVLTLIMSGINIDFFNINKDKERDSGVIEVEAGDGSGVAVGGNSGNGNSAEIDSTWPDSTCSGMRFSLVPKALLSSGKKFEGIFKKDEKENSVCYTANDMNKYISARQRYSILVTKFTGTVYCMPNRGEGFKDSNDREHLYCEQIKAKSLNDIFGEVLLSKNETRKVSFPERLDNSASSDGGEGIFTSQLWTSHGKFDTAVNNRYFGAHSYFNKILEIENNCSNMIGKFKTYLGENGRHIDDDISQNNFVLVVEPVVISHVTDDTGVRASTNVKGKYFAVSLQDCLGRDCKGDKWSYAFTQFAYPCQNETPEEYIHPPKGLWRTLLYNMKNYYFQFSDKKGIILGNNEATKFRSGVGLSQDKPYWDTGFGVFTFCSGNIGSKAKTGVSYTLFTDKSADSKKVKVNKVWGKSLGTVIDDNYKTIKVSLNNDTESHLSTSLDDGVSNLKETTYSTSSNGSFTYNKDSKVAGSNLSKQLTGKDKDVWESKLGKDGDKYTNQGFGVVKIPYQSDVDRKLSTLYKATTGTDVISDIKKISIETTAETLKREDCNKAFGKRYSIGVKTADNEPSVNIAEKVAGILRANADSIFDQSSYTCVYNTKVKFSKLGSMSSYNKFRNIAMNGSLYALNCSKSLDNLIMDTDGENGKITTRDAEGGKKVLEPVDSNGDGEPDVDEDGDIIYTEVTKNMDTDELSTLGISVMLMTPKRNVTSYIAGATLDRDTKKVSNKKQDSKTYDVTESGVLKIPRTYKSKCFYVVVPNTSLYNLSTDLTGSKVFDSFNGNDSISSLDEFKEHIKQVTGLTDSDFVGSGDDLIGGSTIRVGSTDRSKGAVKGYSVIILETVGTVTKRADLELMDYELNYIYPSMLTNNAYGSLLSDVSYETVSTSLVSNGCNSAYTANTVCDNDKYIQASSNYAGNIINKNMTLGANKNILQYDLFTGGIFTTEEEARNGYTFRDNLTNVKFSLAVNLIRSSFGDKRVVSSITAQTQDDGKMGGITKDYAQTNLELTFGNKPNNILSASEIRNSKATVGSELKDLFEWDVKYVYSDYNKFYRTDLATETVDSCGGHPHPHSAADGGTYYTYSWCNPLSYKVTVKTEVPASDFGTKVKYDVSEKAYKYQPDILETATSSTKTIPNSLQTSDNGLNNTSSVVTSPYKIAVVNRSNEVLKFYPEVWMRAYSSTGNKIDDTYYNSRGDADIQVSNYVKSHNILTMGEVVRTVKPSAMYAIKLVAPSNNVLTGKTISDSTAVGSNAEGVSGDKPVIYAGGNVSLKVDSNFKLNMYGYSLDLIEPSDNNIVNVGNYNSVIADGSPVKTDWGNTSSYKPQDEFNNWIKDTLSKIAVDMTLTVKGNGVDKTYNNFTSSVGDLGVNNSDKDGVYNIKVKQGVIVKDEGYNALINQIKADYDCDATKAEQLFTSSDIWQSISRAVEDCNDDFNKSDGSNAIDATRDHWYDEEVKTFVIRRYKKEGIEIKNIMVNDKIDYGAAPTSDNTTASLSGYKGADARWYMTLYFKELPTGFSDGTGLYKPNNHSNLSNANSAGTVLINEVYVNGADFVVPSASTYDMGN